MKRYFLQLLGCYWVFQSREWLGFVWWREWRGWWKLSELYLNYLGAIDDLAEMR